MRSYRTFSPLPFDSALTGLAQGGVFSVALSLGSPPVGVTDHPALWSPDFPPRPPVVDGAITRPSPAALEYSNPYLDYNCENDKSVRS